MKYPLIYSISTVGIRKHLHQDYLLHPLRTDFTGRNGVGKSVLADLFQLIFIADRKLIEFGTKGINKRAIETIPLSDFHEGYAFINIQMDKDSFITIGVCIPTHISTDIKLFNITSSTDWKQPIKHLKLTKEKLLFSKHFLTESSNVPSIKTLQKQLRDNYGLYLKPFSTKNQKEDYYNWLYNKNILPINLSLEDNLKAFARVIQSFSKSDALDIDNPKILKDFLFEDTVKENKTKFDKEKDKLHNELTKYNTLSREIEEYRQKQQYLEELNKRQKAKENSLQEYYCTLKKQYNETTQKLNSTEEAKDKLLPQVDKLEELIERSEEEYKSAFLALNNLNDYNDKYKNLGNKRSKRNELAKQNEISKKQIEECEGSIRTYSKQAINIEAERKEITKYFDVYKPIKEKSEANVRIINECSDVYEKYNSFNRIEQKYIEQREQLREQLNKVDKNIKSLNEVTEIVQNKKENTFFKFIAEKGTVLSVAQETVLFHLINLLIVRPDNPQTKLFYTNNPHEILSEENITETPYAVWFNYGNIVEYIPNKVSRRFFDTKEKVNNVFENQQTDIKRKIEYANKIKNELSKIEKGQNYHKDIIKDYEFDEVLFAWSPVQLKKFKDYESLISKKDKSEYRKEDARLSDDYGKNKIREGELNSEAKKLNDDIKNNRNKIVDNKNKIEEAELQISSLDKEIEVLLSVLEELSVKIGIPIQVTKLSDLTEQFKEKKQVKENRKDNLLKTKPKYIELKTKLAEQIQKLKVETENLGREKETLDKELLKLESDRTPEEYSIDKSNSELSLDDLKIKFTERKQSYIEWYSNISEHNNFSETSNLNNPQLTTQINDKSYSFKVIEQILLGSQIRYTDKIADHLEVANRNRKEISIALYERILSIFSLTSGQYKKFEQTIRGLNSFFTDKKISDEFIFSIKFLPKGKFNIDWINSIPKDYLFNHGDELQFGSNDLIESFIIDFFNDVNKVKIHSIAELLNPKNFFELKVDLTDEKGDKISGSTGETYSSIILLGIGRLSEKQILVDEEDRPGLRFVILEETSNLDKNNFNIFTEIAYDFNYQLITMTPEPYGSDKETGWYLHHLIKGAENRDINEPNPASYFKTTSSREQLETYLERINP